MIDSGKLSPIPEKRKNTRLILLAPLGVKLFQPSKEEIGVIKVVDISHEGLSLIISNRLSIGSTVLIRFKFPSSHASIMECTAQVRRCEERTGLPDLSARFLCGLSLQMSSAEKQKWDEWIQEILRDQFALMDRRSAGRLRNGLAFDNPAKYSSYGFSRESPFVQIHQLGIQDLDELERVEAEAWGEDMRATREMLKSRLEVFPEGMIGARIDGKLIGYVALLMIHSKSLGDHLTWEGISDGGSILTTHTPEGDCLYGISLAVSPGAAKSIAVLLVKAGQKLSLRKALKGIFLGSRIP